MTDDLALLAERRAGLAALLGLLILEEPGPGLQDFVEHLPGLEALASDDKHLRAEYARLFLHGVPPYESVFTSADGQHDPALFAEIVAHYDEVDFDEHRDTSRWRIAGPDHIGLQLRCYARLCHAEAIAWRSGHPNDALRAVETERTFLARRLAAWSELFLDAARGLAGDGPYTVVLESLATFLDEEYDRLRPGSEGGDLLDDAPPPVPSDLRLGPFRIAALVLVPSAAGTYIPTEVLAASAATIGAAWRPNDTRASFRHTVADAMGSNDLATLLKPIGDELRRAAQQHELRSKRCPGNATNLRRFAHAAIRTEQRLAGLTTSDSSPEGSRATATLSISSRDRVALDELIEAVRELVTCKGGEVLHID